MSAVIVQVDITDRGAARIEGPVGDPRFAGHVGTGFGPRSSTNRPTYTVTLTDDTPDVFDTDRAPLPCTTRALRHAFPADAVRMARLLAAHYGVDDATFEIDDETGTYALP